MNISITPERFEAKRKELAAQGIDIKGESGRVEAHGVKVDYKYDGATLSLAVISKPFIISTAAVEGRLKAWFTE